MNVVRRIAALAVLGLILLGCTGGDGDAEPAPTPSAATPVATPTATATPAPTSTPTATPAPSPTSTATPTPTAAQFRIIEGVLRGPNGSRLIGLGVWLWGGSLQSSKFTTTAWDGTFALIHREGTFTLIVYVPSTEAYIGWYSENSPGGFTTTLNRATAFRLNGDSFTEIEMRLPAAPEDLSPAMSSDTAAEVPAPDVVPAVAATATPRPTATRNAIPTVPEVMFVGEVPPDRQAAYRAAMENVVAYYADRYGVEAENYRVYIGADIEVVRSVYRELGGRYPETLIGEGGRVSRITGDIDAMFIYSERINSGPVADRILAHEYFHILQGYLSGETYSTPWLVEGTAIYASFLYDGTYDNEQYYEGFRERLGIQVAGYDGPLSNLEDTGEWQDQKIVGYAMAALGTEWLVKRAGDGSHVDYWRILPDSATWQDAFAAAFGITVDDFYRAFEDYLSELVSDLRQVRGVVRGAQGEPLGRVGVWLWAGSTENSEFIGTFPDGTFSIVALDGTFTIKVYVLEAGAWRHIGWYGKGGFTTDRDQATVIELDGADVTGIEIRLPADPADLPTIE